MPEFPDRLLTTRQAAAKLGCSPRTLEAWRTRAAGPPFLRLGGLCRYAASDLSAWVRANRCSSGAISESKP